MLAPLSYPAEVTRQPVQAAGSRCRQQLLHQPPSQPPPAAPLLFAGCVSMMDGADMLNYSGWMSSESW